MTDLWRHVSTFLLVTVVTMSIWLYAERQAVGRYTGEVVNVRLVPRSAETAVYPSTSFPVLVDIIAARSQFQAFDQAVREVVELPAPLARERFEDQALRLRELLQTYFESNGINVNVVGANSEVETVRVDRINAINVPARTVTPENVTVNRVEPDGIVVHAAEHLLDVAGSLAAEVVLPQSVTERGQPNVPRVGVFPVTGLPEALLADPWTRLDPARVEVSYTVDQQTISAVLPRVPKVVTLPAAYLATTDVTLPDRDPFVRDLRVSGPAAAVERLTNGQGSVFAEVFPTAEQLEQGVDRLPVFIRGLPAGVVAENAPTSFAVNITRRRTTERQPEPTTPSIDESQVPADSTLQ